MNTRNQRLEDLIEAINHVSLNQEDLLSACLEFSKIYVHKDHKSFDKFWGEGKFIEQSCMSAREAIVLALHALTLAEEIEFISLIDGCLNLEAQTYNLNELTSEESEQKLLKDFFFSLRKELFSRVYSQNKSLQKVTDISKKILEQRKETFMEKMV